jgi:hypothetical protein
MRVPAALWILGVVAASAGVSAVASGQASTWGTGKASSRGDAGTISAAPSAEEEEEEEEDAHPDAGAGPSPEAGSAGSPSDAGAGAGDDGSSGPSNVGFAIGLHGGYSIPFGNENGVAVRDYVIQGAIPIGVDLGWFITPRFYVGVALTYGIGVGAARLNPTCGDPDVDCSAQMYSFGAVAHWHFRPEERWDPWVGVGFGYETVQVTATSQVDNSTVNPSPALQGLDLSLGAGLDFKPLRYVGVGPYVEGAAGPYVAGASGFDIHGWAVVGVRFRMNLF